MKFNFFKNLGFFLQIFLQVFRNCLRKHKNNYFFSEKFDKEYRTTLKNVQGYNAEQLMEQSLDNLGSIFEKKNIDNNQEALN